VDPLAVYGAVTGSAGLLGLGYQAWVKRTDERDRVDITVYYTDQRRAEPIDQDKPGVAVAYGLLEVGVGVSVVNRSKHAIFLAGGGIEQEDPEFADCAVFMTSTEVGPRRSHGGFFIPEWWIDSEEIDLARPIRAFISLDDGSMYRSSWTVLRPVRPQRSR
jgi:hypothetical protein